MATLSDVLNGSDVFLRVKTASRWLIIGGQLSHSQTKTNAPIDITHKQNGSVRDVLVNEGLQTMEVSSELIFSTDTAFDFIKTSASSKSIELFQVVRGTINGVADNVDEFSAMISSFVETSPDNDKHSAAVTFMSSGAFVEELTYAQFLTSTSDRFLTSDSDLFLVRN